MLSCFDKWAANCFGRATIVKVASIFCTLFLLLGYNPHVFASENVYNQIPLTKMRQKNKIIQFFFSVPFQCDYITHPGDTDYLVEFLRKRVVARPYVFFTPSVSTMDTLQLVLFSHVNMCAFNAASTSWLVMILASTCTSTTDMEGNQ